MSDASRQGRTATELIAAAYLDAELTALLWLLIDGGVPLVVATTHGTSAGEELRTAMAALVGGGRTTADGTLPGGTVHGTSLEDLLRLGGAAESAEVPDGARELGVVVVLGQPDLGDEVRLVRAHYVRPIERDAAGHTQRRPPALLSALDEEMSRLDHFFWAITDELATRVATEAHEFDVAHRRRSRLLSELVAARVFDSIELRRHIERAALVESGALGVSQADTPN